MNDTGVLVLEYRKNGTRPVDMPLDVLLGKAPKMLRDVKSVVPAQKLLELASVDLRDAAAFSVAHTTAMHTLRTIADLQPGETVLVLGAAGGVGLASVELATLLGGQVIAAA